MYSRLAVLDLGSAALTDDFDLIPGLVYTDMISPVHEQVAWAEDDSNLFVAWHNATQASEVYEAFTGKRWTSTALHTPGLCEPDESAYPSFDGRHIPALLFSTKTPGPTVVCLHGGPEAQMRGAFNPVIQLLCAAGLNVLAPNVRGSTGYGTTYAQLDDRDLRWDSVRDGSAAAEFLTSSGIATTVGAEGVSYGGFMAVAVMIDSPSLWQAGVDIVGIADWETYFRSTPGWRRPLRAESYGDPDRPEDVAFLRRFSPLRRAKELQAPLLIVHDRHDPRVPVSEAELIASAAPGCELIVVEGEGHWFVQAHNREAVFARVLDFLLDHLQ